MLEVIQSLVHKANEKSRTKINFISKFDYKNVAFIFGVLLLSAIPAISVSTASADSLDYAVNINTSLSVTVSSNTISLNLNPSITPFATTDLNVAVGTNNFSGYKLYINADSTNLTNSAASATIATLSGEATGTQSLFPENKWGYRISSGTTGDSTITDTDGTKFFPFASGTLVSSSSVAVNNNASVLTFASKIDYEKPSGTYSLDFNFKALPVVTTYTMQDMDFSVCTEDPTIVTDSRDGQAYTIAKLADGNCWMLDNLSLDLTDTAVQSRLNSTTTNATDEILGYLINGGGSSPYPASGVSSAWTSSAQNSNVLPYIATSGLTVDGDAWDKNDVASVRYGDGAGKIGIYYNYCAASAGSYCYASNAGTGNASYDVCPVGWRMPTGGPDGEYQTLCSIVKGSTCVATDTDPAALALRDVLSTSFTGSFYDGSKHDSGSGAFWSSTTASDESYGVYMMYRLDVRRTSVNTERTNARRYGFSVRCLLPNPNS